jgi:hypothetical protein
MAEKIFHAGTAVKISTLLNQAGASAVTITIEDPGSVVKVKDVAMTQSSNTVFYYVYQSAETDSLGEYVATIKATFGANTALDKQIFNIVE